MAGCWRRVKFLLFGALLCLPAHAAEESKPASISEVLTDKTVWATHSEKRPWKTDEFLCVSRAQEVIACGVVAQVDGNRAQIALDFTNRPVEVGDAVSLAPRTKPAPTVPTETDEVQLIAPTRPKTMWRNQLLHDVDGFWVGALALERATSPHVSWGARAEYFDVFGRKAELEGYSLVLTRSYYTLRSFGGVCAQISAGVYLFRNPLTRSQDLEFIGETALVWRFGLLRWLHVGLRFALRYVSRPVLDGVDLQRFPSFRGVLGPELTIQL